MSPMKQNVCTVGIALAKKIHIPTKLLTPSRRTPSAQAVSSSSAVYDGLLCCHSVGWLRSDDATRSTVT